MILVLFLMGFGTSFSYTMDRKHDFEINEKLLEEYSSEDEFVQALLDEYNITSQEDLDDLLAASNFTLDDLSNFTIPDDIPIDVPFPTNGTTPSFGGSGGEIPNGTIPDDILINSTFVGF
jgi:hypothetical protein